VKVSCEAIAEVFVGLFTEELWRPSLDESEAVAAVERLRPVAAETVMALFDQAMADEAGRAIRG
jgi:hypothetical protein